MTNKGGLRHRTSSNWRYKIIKSYRKRARKFKETAPSKEEAFAWAMVEGWFDSIMERRYVNEHGSIALPLVEVSDP